MKRSLFLALIFLFVTVSCKNACDTVVNDEPAEEWAIVLHAGAGGSKPVPQEKADNIKIFLEEALSQGKAILDTGGSALDAVQATVVYMENCPIFNAGKGAVSTADGKHELDACIMDGSNLNAGAVAGVTDIKNPIKAARLVMEQSPHVLLISDGASYFAKQNGLEIVPNSYFDTEEKKIELEQLLKSKKEGAPHGTVGCVALDKHGNIAAATSTGGMSGKKWGRVGDSPIVGASTYAKNGVVGVSSTGHGEFWIRRCVAYDICAQMEYKNSSVEEAAKDVIWNKIDQMEGCSGGGVICLDSKGHIAMEFNTATMNRAWATASGNNGVEVNKTEADN